MSKHVGESFREPHLALDVFIGLYSFLLLYLYFYATAMTLCFYLLISV